MTDEENLRRQTIEILRHWLTKADDEKENEDPILILEILCELYGVK